MAKISAEDTKEILSLTEDDIDMKLLKDYFAIKGGNDKPRFNTYDKITVPANPELGLTSAKETTVGRYLFNFYCLPTGFLKKYGYQDIVLTKKSFKSLEASLGKMVLNDQLTSRDYIDYMNKTEWMTMGIAYFLSPSLGYDFNVSIPEVIDLKNNLYDKYQKEIKSGDMSAISAITNEVVSLAKKKIKEKNDPAYDFYDSGAFDFNNYAKTSIMVGAIDNPYSHKLYFSKSNLIDGISKKDMCEFSNLIVNGGVAKGVETMESGYQTKKVNNIMQTVTLDAHGTDCCEGIPINQRLYGEIRIDKDNGFLYVDRYILDGGKEIILTDENIKDYYGKTVKIRTPMYCKNDKICNKCAGELFYKMNIMNAGLLTSTFSGVLLNAGMKVFHDSTVEFKGIPIEEYIIDEN